MRKTTHNFRKTILENKLIYILIAIIEHNVIGPALNRFFFPSVINDDTCPDYYARCEFEDAEEVFFGGLTKNDVIVIGEPVF